MANDKPKRDVVNNGDRVRYVLPDGESREAEVVTVFNPGVYPRGGVVALKIRVSGPTDCLGGELPRGPGGVAVRVVTAKNELGNVVDSIRLVDDDGWWRKKGVAYMPKKSGVPGTWHWSDDA